MIWSEEINNGNIMKKMSQLTAPSVDGVVGAIPFDFWRNFDMLNIAER